MHQPFSFLFSTATLTTDRFAYARWFAVAALAGLVALTGASAAYGQTSAPGAYHEPAQANNAQANSNARQNKFAKGQILVGKKKSSGRGDFDAAISAEGVSSTATLVNLDVDIVKVPPGREKDMVARLKGNKHVEFAEVDEEMEPAATVSDPSVGSQWHIAKINAPAAWDYTLGGGVKIAILDSGVDGTHPDLAPQMVAGWNFYDNNSNTADVRGHGTAVAGAAAAAANNGVGVAGVAGGAKIMPLRIADSTGYALWSTAAQAINYAADHGARVANLSFVGAAASSTIQSAASYLRSKGGVLFVAAGNSGAVDNTSPTNLMQVVSATDESDQLASFSTYGSFVTVSAPGNNILTTAMGGGYQYWWGTSLATPVAAGTAALIIASRPDFTPAQIDSTLKSSATDLGGGGTDPYFGAGRINAGAAVALAGGASTPGDSTAPTVAITSPASGSVSGTTTVTVGASDNVGVTRVDVKVNGTTIATDTTAPFSVSWNTTTLANGSVALTATAYDAAGNSATSSNVYVTVANGDATPPSVSILSPSGGATVAGQVTVTANASDNIGVTRLDFRIDGATVATTNASPYQFVWATTQYANGAKTLTATAFDAAGNQATSTPMSVTVNNVSSPSDVSPPQVAITSPQGGSVDGLVTVSVTASDDIGVTHVDLMVNGLVVASTSTAPYRLNWDTGPYANGSATLTAVAYDASGKSATSAPVTVNVSQPPAGGGDTTPPVLTVKNPVNGAMVTGVVQISATASDNAGTAGLKLSVMVDGVQKATATGGTITYNWNAKKVAPGTHTIVVTARDAAGNNTSKQVQVTRK